jgi:hypothetical protein
MLLMLAILPMADIGCGRYSGDVQDRKGETIMLKSALLVRLEAKPGKESDVMAFLETGLALANLETTTALWFALRLGPTTFGVFDAFTG